MQPYNKAVMTDKAIELLNKAQAGLCQIEITRMGIGDGEYLSAEKKEEYLKGQLELKNEKNSYPISSKGVSSDNSIIITAILSNQDPITFETLVEKGYCISEIGIFAKENGSDDEILYSIAVAEKLGDYMPAFEGSNPAQIIQSYQITVNNMETAEVVINYAGAAMLASEGQAHVADQERHVKENERENWNNKLDADSDVLKEAIDDAKIAQATAEAAQDAAATAQNIAKGRNQAHVFRTTADMQEFLSDVENTGKYNVGDNIYIVEIDVPDWWVSEVLTEADAETGYYYKIAQLETQKVDLTEILAVIATAEENIDTLENEVTWGANGGSYMGVNSNGEVAKITIEPNESREIPIEVKEVVQSHDNALNVLNNDLKTPTSFENIDISAYTADSEKKYLCPSDGLAWMSCNGISTTGYMNIYASDGITWTYMTCPPGHVINFPVKKGMYIQGSGFAIMRFVKYNK